MRLLVSILPTAALMAVSLSPTTQANEPGERPSAAEASAALRKAVMFFREDVSAEGGYLWRYSADLSRREGENQAGPNTAWLQPPGTPAVGEAFLTAYELTGEEYLLDAARETGRALVRGQLQSGGWDNLIEFDPKQRRRYAYRADGNAKGRNTTTLDDDKTQSAVRFLMHLDRTLGFEDEAIHEATLYALDSLVKAQYPNGAWPQRFSEPPDPNRHPVKPASVPASWPREYPKTDYSGHYTFNDNTLADTIGVMLDAAETYGDERYRRAAEKGGDFILLAQLPEPQPAWAQQYNAEMHPAWARKFEPPAVTGGESQGVLRILMELYRRTGERRFLEPIPRALRYLKKSRRADGRLARFYELGTNRPLYLTREYELTYRDDDLPTHYGFIVGSKLDAIEAEYEKLRQTDPAEFKERNPPRESAPPRLSRSLAERARQVIAAMDERGAWVEAGTLRSAPEATDRIIECRTFNENVQTLARYVAAAPGAVRRR